MSVSIIANSAMLIAYHTLKPTKQIYLVDLIVAGARETEREYVSEKSA